MGFYGTLLSIDDESLRLKIEAVESEDASLYQYDIYQGYNKIYTLNIPRAIFLQTAEIVNADDEGNPGKFLKLASGTEQDPEISILYIDIGDLWGGGDSLNATYDATTQTLTLF